MTTRLARRTCGDLIHPDTAAKNNGLCMPCKGCCRERIEEGKRQRELERAYEKSAERRHWLSMVERVHQSKEGFQTLSPDEQTYFALRCLIGEVFNGGFHQFFANHSGEYYGVAVNGLFELEAMRSHQLLTQAKEVLFGDQAVPLGFAERNQLLRAVEENDVAYSRIGKQLEELDKQFWAELDELSNHCLRFAIARGLYASDAQPFARADLHRLGTWPANRPVSSSVSRAKRQPGGVRSAQTLGVTYPSLRGVFVVEKHLGGCVCGSVRYQVAGSPAVGTVCHCKFCQKRLASAFAVLASFKEEAVEFLQGDLHEVEHRSDESGRWLRMTFCARCGTTVAHTAELRPGMRTIAAGTFDDPSWFRIDRHIWVQSKLAWVNIPDGVATYMQGFVPPATP